MELLRNAGFIINTRTTNIFSSSMGGEKVIFKLIKGGIIKKTNEQERIKAQAILGDLITQKENKIKKLEKYINEPIDGIDNIIREDIDEFTSEKQYYDYEISRENDRIGHFIEDISTAQRYKFEGVVINQHNPIFSVIYRGELEFFGISNILHDELQLSFIRE